MHLLRNRVGLTRTGIRPSTSSRMSRRSAIRFADKGHAARSLPLAPFPATAQFSSALSTTEVDAIVLSIQPDVAVPVARHRRDGYLCIRVDGSGGQKRIAAGFAVHSFARVFRSLLSRCAISPPS